MFRAHNQGPEHVGFGVLNYYCDPNEVCAFVVLHCNNWNVMHRMENVRIVQVLMYSLPRNCI